MGPGCPIVHAEGERSFGNGLHEWAARLVAQPIERCRKGYVIHTKPAAPTLSSVVDP
jgi:hypothetical protein